MSSFGPGANWVIREATEDYVIIEDVGPWDKFKSVTNAAESVVEELVEYGLDGRRLYYLDSERYIDELRVNSQNQFVGFRPGGPNDWPRDKFVK